MPGTGTGAGVLCRHLDKAFRIFRSRTSLDTLDRMMGMGAYNSKAAADDNISRQIMCRMR